MISVVVVTYRRIETLESVLQAWLEQTADVVLADCSNHFETNLPITHIKFKPDLGNKTRHAAALLTTGDYVIKADDDIMPKPGLIQDFCDAYKRRGDGIFGLLGRVFQGDSYYKKTSAYRSFQLKSDVPVDFVGVTTFTPRKYLPFDLKGCLSPIEDLFWQMKCYPKAPKWVVATDKYENLKTASDESCLFHSTEARRIREEFYRKYYLKNYENQR